MTENMAVFAQKDMFLAMTMFAIVRFWNFF